MVFIFSSTKKDGKMRDVSLDKNTEIREGSKVGQKRHQIFIISRLEKPLGIYGRINKTKVKVRNVVSYKELTIAGEKEETSLNQT